MLQIEEAWNKSVYDKCYVIGIIFKSSLPPAVKDLSFISQ